LRSVILDSLKHLCLKGSIHTKRFAIEMNTLAPAAGRSRDKPWLRRIFVCFFPEFDRANDYLDAKPPRPVPGGAHLSLKFVPTRTAPHPLLTVPAPAQLELLSSEINDSLFLYALGRSPFIEDPTTLAAGPELRIVARDGTIRQSLRTDGEPIASPPRSPPMAPSGAQRTRASTSPAESCGLARPPARWGGSRPINDPKASVVK
jgi:hypothetical protein